MPDRGGSALGSFGAGDLPKAILRRPELREAKDGVFHRGSSPATPAAPKSSLFEGFRSAGVQAGSSVSSRQAAQHRLHPGQDEVLAHPAGKIGIFLDDLLMEDDLRIGQPQGGGALAQAEMKCRERK